MLPGGSLPAEETEQPGSPSEGDVSPEPPREILSACDPPGRGNTIAADLISTQPPPAASPPAGDPELFGTPLCDTQQPTCPRCGLAGPDLAGAPPRPSPSLSRPRRSGSSARRRGRGGKMAAAEPAGSCPHLLLACLWCRCPALLLGLLGACSSCLLAGCGACARCCSAACETPTEELNCHAHCHAVLFQSCCEPTECLELCLECCEICHRG